MQVNSSINAQKSQMGFGIKINPELIKKGKLSQNLIKKISKLGDSNTILEKIEPDSLKMTFSHPALGKLSEFSPSKASTTIEQTVDSLNDAYVKNAEDTLIFSNYYLARYNTPWNFQQRINTYEETSKRINDMLSDSSTRLKESNAAFAEKFKKDEATPITYINKTLTMKYPQDTIK